MPIRYIPYYPEPIQGQALLNNFTRSQRALKYRDNNDKVFSRILRGLPLYEIEQVESIGKNPNGNLLIRGECISACAYLKQQNIKVDLVYIDPPFASGADYAKKIYLRRNPKVAKAIAQAEQEMEDDDLRGFEEKMYGDIWNKEAYLNWMYENLHAIKSIMSETGSIYVHLDWHVGHYVKILMDEIFGEDNFVNEIVWCYTGPTNQKRNFPRKHDNIFIYTLNKEEYIFNGDDIRISFKKSMKSGGKTALTGKASDIKLEEIDEKGKIPEDWWIDIPDLGKVHSEDLNYATQKSESLLQRVIRASSNKKMVIADFFGGSGVTAKVAHDLGRKFIHADVGINSIQTTRDRLKTVKASFEVLEVQDGISLFRNPIQTMDKLFGLITGLGKVKELDKFWAGAIHDSKKGLMPVFLPNLLDHTQKILDKPLINRVLNEALPDLPDEVNQVIVYYVDIEDKKELEKFIQEYNPTQIKVELRDLKEVLHEIVSNDEVEYKINKDKIGTSLEFTRFYSDRLIQKIDSYNQKRGLNQKANQSDMEDENDVEVVQKKSFNPIEVSKNGLELIELISLDCSSTKGKWHSDVEIKIDKKGFVIRDGEKTKEFWDGKITSKEKPLRLKVRNIAGDETILDLK